MTSDAHRRVTRLVTAVVLAVSSPQLGGRDLRLTQTCARHPTASRLH